ncbi:MAG: RecX family transcriptional regulator [Eubacteriales bacterium]|nr:RecX family transcriptional regulator [Eubacteriales bacterium]
MTDSSILDAELIEYRQAREFAVNYIGSNFSRAKADIVRRLLRAGYARPLAEQVAADLAEIDYVSDYRAAKVLLRRHQGRQAKGNLYLNSLLQQKGIERAAAEEALSELAPESERLAELCASYQADLERKGPIKARRFLYGRGFPNYLIEREMERIFDA